MTSIRRSLAKRSTTKAVEKMTQQQQDKPESTTASNIHQSDDPFAHQVIQQTKKVFDQLVCDPRSATVMYQGREGDRYIFLAAKGLSVDFFGIVREFFGVPDEVIVICIYICIYVYICMYICIYVFIIFIFKYINMLHVYTHTNKYVSIYE